MMRTASAAALLLLVRVVTLHGQLNQPPTITNHQLNGPSRLEINLGPMPLDQYDDMNCQGAACVNNCASTLTVRHCFQNALGAYAADGVTGVRFLFAYCGGGYSTPLTGCGGTVAVSSAWLSELNEFFADIYASGIRNITPTPAPTGFGGDAGVAGYYTPYYYTVADTTSPCNIPGGTQIVWWPATPYPTLWSSSGRAAPFTRDNNDYICVPGNTVSFVGWQNIYAVVGEVLQAAASSQLVVDEPVEGGTLWQLLAKFRWQPSGCLHFFHLFELRPGSSRPRLTSSAISGSPASR